MAITIKKKGTTTERRDPAPVVGDTVPEAVTVAPPKTPKQILDSWKDVPPPGAKPRQCPHCAQFYIKPCTDEQYVGCMNWQHVQAKKAKGDKA